MSSYLGYRVEVCAILLLKDVVSGVNEAKFHMSTKTFGTLISQALLVCSTAPWQLKGRDTPRRNGVPTRHDPSVYGRPMPPCVPPPQAYHRDEGYILAHAVQQVDASVIISIPTSTPGADSVTICTSSPIFVQVP
jgi:hypothetical protein